MGASLYRKIGYIAGVAIVVGVVSLEGLFVHELGHGITTQVLGGQFKGLYVFPGVQVWPSPGRPYDGEWGLDVGQVDAEPGEGWGEWQRGLVLLMGSGSTMMLAALAFVTLWLLRPKGWLSYVLIAEALLYLDILFYTIMPEWFGLRHWVFIGGRYPEPLEGAEMMGCPRMLFLMFILLTSALMTLGVAKYVIRLLGASRGE